MFLNTEAVYVIKLSSSNFQLSLVVLNIGCASESLGELNTNSTHTQLLGGLEFPNNPREDEVPAAFHKAFTGDLNVQK